MNIRKLKRLFATRRRADDGSPAPLTWLEGDGEAALINPDSGRVYAYVWHDGYGKYYPTLIVSPWRALRLVRSHCGFLVSLLSFPRVTVELVRLKEYSLRDALQVVEAVLETTA